MLSLSLYPSRVTLLLLLLIGLIYELISSKHIDPLSLFVITQVLLVHYNLP